jgi:hypothetical protein
MYAQPGRYGPPGVTYARRGYGGGGMAMPLLGGLGGGACEDYVFGGVRLRLSAGMLLGSMMGGGMGGFGGGFDGGGA